MIYGQIIRRAAESDIRDAYSYYEACRVGLGQEFLLSVEATLARISRNPEQFRSVHKDIKRVAIHRFPYAIFFIVRNDSVIVLAVMHARRDPAQWHGRQEA